MNLILIIYLNQAFFSFSIDACGTAGMSLFFDFVFNHQIRSDEVHVLTSSTNHHPPLPAYLTYTMCVSINYECSIYLLWRGADREFVYFQLFIH